jgi:polyphenol oxidase
MAGDAESKKTPPRRSPARTAKENPAWRLRRAGGLRILAAPALAKLAWLVHGFTTRPGGVSELEKTGNSGKPERVLNLGFTDWDSRENVIENRRKFAETLGAGKMRMVTLRQIHSDVVHLANNQRTAPQQPCKGDALFTRERGILLAVQTADCIPILLADLRRHAIAAVHSGWRGTLSRIAEKTLGRMRMEFGTRPADVMAALGPGIRGCCYEVGQEVAKKFAAQFPNARDWFEGPFDAIAVAEGNTHWLPWLTMMPPGHVPDAPGVHLDLIAANRDILAAAGIPPENIFASGFCTACRRDLFFSYRGERKTGRLMAAIGIL